ncbi:MAG: hypothetical protein HOW73_47475, partial [Polyangiaceae bacterium]|nr:hypothetical protein [Polyangiaceae bacterium]
MAIDPNVSFSFDDQETLEKVQIPIGGVTNATVDDTAGLNSLQWVIVSSCDLTDPSDWTIINASVAGCTVVGPPGMTDVACLLEARGNGGAKRGTNGKLIVGNLVKSAKIYVGTEVGVVGETTQSDPNKGQAAFVNPVLRAKNAPLPTGTITIPYDASDTTGAGFRAKLVAALLVTNSIQL